jgi:hypothetical protein
VDLRQKLQHLRAVEGQLRGFDRPLSKAEVVRMMAKELGESVSQSYFSQLEGGSRIHLSAHSRDLLARFFKVHPGYLVSDPIGYEEVSEVDTPMPTNDTLSTLLAAAAERVKDDPLVYRALLRLAHLPDTRRYLLLLDDLLDQPPEQLRRLAESVRSVSG